MPYYQGALEQRVRSWFTRAETSPGRALRLALLVAPFVLAAICGVSLCPVALVVRAPCPGCGLTRSAWALAQGDFANALAYNPLAPVICPLFVAGLAYLVGRYVLTGRTQVGRWIIGVAILLNLALVVVWVARFCGAFGGPVAV